MASTTVSVVLQLVDRVTGPARAAMGRLANIRSDSISKMADRQASRLQASTVETTAMAAAFYAAIRPAVEFESAMASVQKVVDFESPEHLRQVMNMIQELASTELAIPDTGIAEIVRAAGAANLLNSASSAEELNEQIREIILQTGRMAVAFDISAEQAGATLRIWRNGMNLTAEQSKLLADAVNVLGNNTGATEPQLLDVLTRIGPLGKLSGLAAEEVAGLSAAVLSAGAPPERAATAIRNFTNRLGRGNALSKRAKEVVKDLGLEHNKLAKSMQMDAKGTILDVLERFEKLPEESRVSSLTTLLGDEAAPGIAPLVGNLDSLRHAWGLVEDQTAIAGSAYKEFAVQSGTTANQFQLLINYVSALSTTLAISFLPALNEMMDAIRPFLEALRTWAEANPEMTIAIFKLVTALIAFRVAVWAARLSLIMFLRPLGLIQRALGLLIRFVGLFNPFVLIATAAALAAYLIYRNWDNFSAYFIEKFNTVREAFKTGFLDGMTALWQEFNLFTLMKDAFLTFGSWLTQTLDDQLSGISLYDEGKRIIQTLWTGMSELVEQMVAEISAKISEIVPDWLRNAWNWVSGGGGVSQVATPSSAVVPPGSGGNSTSIGSITVNSNASDPEAVASEVIAEIERRETVGSSRRRSQPLFDSPEYDS